MLVQPARDRGRSAAGRDELRLGRAPDDLVAATRQPLNRLIDLRLGCTVVSDRHKLAIEIRVLGRVDALVDGRSLPLKEGKQRGVLAILALRANRTVSADELIDGLWADRPPASAAKNLQSFVSQLRKALASDDAEASILTRGRGYELRVAEERGRRAALRAPRRRGRPRTGGRRGERRGQQPRSSSGAAPRSPTSPPSPSPDPRSAGSRSFTCGRSSWRSTPSSPPGATPRRSPDSRR